MSPGQYDLVERSVTEVRRAIADPFWANIRRGVPAEVDGGDIACIGDVFNRRGVGDRVRVIGWLAGGQKKDR